MTISERSGPGVHLVYVTLPDLSSLPLLGCELRRPIAEGLITLPSFRDDHGLLLVQALPTRSQEGDPLEERRYLRVL